MSKTAHGLVAPSLDRLDRHDRLGMLGMLGVLEHPPPPQQHLELLDCHCLATGKKDPPPQPKSPVPQSPSQSASQSASTRMVHGRSRKVGARLWGRRSVEPRRSTGTAKPEKLARPLSRHG